jgi:putative spermidine/putrescine transport system ATP-binding protein
MRQLVKFASVSKRFDSGPTVVRDLDLEIEAGEFLTLLGPSGSGKTTTLMMLAGFEHPSEGDILLRGRSITGLLPQERNFGVVFQSYALFPNMTVAENIAFPLMVRSRPRDEIAGKVARALDMVRLAGFGDRHPKKLSGGQQQRVALARALVFGPELVLMDEPLGALDRQLRQEMQSEIKRLHRELELTVIYVTHDQEEALTMSDRIAIFAAGRTQQLGSPREIYEEPGNLFVAGFVGENNLLPGTVVDQSGSRVRVRLEGGYEIEGEAVRRLTLGGAVTAAIRPEALRIGRDRENGVCASVIDVTYLGQRTNLVLDIGGGVKCTVTVPSDRSGCRVGSTVTLDWEPKRCRVYPNGAPA